MPIPGLPLKQIFVLRFMMSGLLKVVADLFAVGLFVSIDLLLQAFARFGDARAARKSGRAQSAPEIGFFHTHHILL